MQLKIFTVLFSLFFLTSFGFKTVEQPVSAVNLSAPALKAKIMDEKFASLYGSLKGSSKPAFEVFEKALIGFINLTAQGKLSGKGMLTIIDYSLPSSEKRLWVIDLAKRSIIFNDLVAHGRNTGNIMAREFSNVPNSNMSSIGFYVTANTYRGKHGMSLRLNGMEEAFNSAAMERAIVMHCADYVSQAFINRYGRLGRSLGCPALPESVGKEIIAAIAEKTCLFISGPDPGYDNESLLLNKESALAFFAGNNFML